MNVFGIKNGTGIQIKKTGRCGIRHINSGIVRIDISVHNTKAGCKSICRLETGIAGNPKRRNLIIRIVGKGNCLIAATGRTEADSKRCQQCKTFICTFHASLNLLCPGT